MRGEETDGEDMLAAYSFDGMVIVSLLFVCTMAYVRSVPRRRKWFMSEKKGFWGVVYKGGVIGSRLHWAVSLACLAMAVYLLILK